MLRTEVVASKNIRKTVFYKVYNVLAIAVFAFILLMVLNVFGPDTTMGKLINENYNNVIRPAILALAFLIFVFSMISRSSMKSPKRLGSIEIDENEIRYLVEDELKETIAIGAIKNIEFEFYSFRMRGNPMGCMNYLKLDTTQGEKNYEIVIANTLIKAELGEILGKINQKVPVKVTYSYFLKKLMKDPDFKF
ncbi:MAG: hypothetical protein ACERKD_08615 [Prolixibacteraceae bacterium]